MEQKLINAIAQLKSDPLHAITVVNGVDASKIETNITGEALAKKYGSVEGFFNGLTQRNIKLFQVANKRKNGNTYNASGQPTPNYKTIGTPFLVDATETTKTESMKPETVHTPQVMQNQAFNPFAQPLNGGLNMMDVSYKYQDYQRLERECLDWKTKCEKLASENKLLENTNLRNELSGEKASANVELAKTFAPMIPAILAKLMPTAGGAALQMPAENLSQIKSELFEMIRRSDDTLNEYLLVVSQGITTNNEFTNELVALLEKHQLIQ